MTRLLSFLHDDTLKIQKRDNTGGNFKWKATIKLEVVNIGETQMSTKFVDCIGYGSTKAAATLELMNSVQVNTKNIHRAS